MGSGPSNGSGEKARSGKESTTSAKAKDGKGRAKTDIVESANKRVR